MPTTGELVLEPVMNESGEKGFYSTFSHNKENASPGYYKVHLDSYNIKAELTATERVGYHQMLSLNLCVRDCFHYLFYLHQHLQQLHMLEELPNSHMLD